jgi:leader peptidase (prepilin peptidase)/N-methyltransferase
MYFIIFIFGLLIGSFLNVCIYRIPRNESISYPPSHCTSCGKRIKWYDLIPVISYIFLKGRCRNCKEKISIRYPVIELTGGIIFLLLFIKYGLSFEFVKFAVMASILIVIALIDFDTEDVYLKTTLSGIISGLIFAILGNYLNVTGNFLNYIYGGAVSGGLIAVIILLTHGMGWGDVEICTMCGLFLGFKMSLVMLFFAFVIGGVTGVLLILTHKKKRRDCIPFGPFIALAAVLTALYGGNILLWYMSLL